MRRFLGQTQKHPIKWPWLLDCFRWHPRCSFSHPSAFRRSLRCFETTDSKGASFGFRKGRNQQETKLWRRNEFRRSRLTSAATPS